MPALLKPKIFIIESQYIVAADLAVHLVELGHQHIGIYKNHEDVVRAMDCQYPYLIIISIALFNNNDGIVLAQKLKTDFRIPIIFTSASVDLETFHQAMDVKPYAVITKPFDRADIQRGLSLAADRIRYASKSWQLRSRMNVVNSNYLLRG